MEIIEESLNSPEYLVGGYQMTFKAARIRCTLQGAQVRYRLAGATVNFISKDTVVLTEDRENADGIIMDYEGVLDLGGLTGGPLEFDTPLVHVHLRPKFYKVVASEAFESLPESCHALL